MPITAYFYELHKFVKLMADIIFINGNAFMLISENKFKFVTVKHISSWTSGQISKILNKAIEIYGRRGLIICIILVDMEF